MTPLNIAIIGAGMAGISAARALGDAGHRVALFDKSRGSGGRMSSKRTDFGSFDMGAQYFTARDHAFRQQVHKWLESGWVAEWTPRLYMFDEAGLAESADDQVRYVGSPRMTNLSRELISDLALYSQTRITRIQRDADNHWQLTDDAEGPHGPFDRVVLATPAPQALDLLQPAPALAQAVAQVGMEPGWTLALAFHEPLPTPVEACFVRSGPIDWISRNSSKPGRGTGDTWVIQSTPAWAREHLDLAPAQIVDELSLALEQVLGLSLPTPSFQHAHRWLYARPAEVHNWGALAAPELGLYLCGDWCLGGRLENAWLSGLQVARTLV
jgi:renalase